MYGELYRRLDALALLDGSALLANGLKGLEKESLRVTENGSISTAPHPRALGSALTHPYITTDYSEALLELITPPSPRNADTLAFLERTHRFVYEGLESELLWATSMPCAVAGDESIPIADYGSSNSGMMRHIYRRGLAHRYGRVMQVISGVHYNYSVALEAWPALQAADQADGDLDSYISERYFGMVRNVLRYGWLLLYLFGASPALCKSFLGKSSDRFQAFDGSTRYEPYATSLRMSDIGYTNSTQVALDVRYDDLDTYVASLRRAIETPHPEYERLGVKVGGEYRQLNANILQIENEFYSVVRPKQITERGEKPTTALSRRGVAYVEVRSLDVNPFANAGVDLEQLEFMELFMLFCLLHESPVLSEDERAAVEANVAAVATRGRDPDIELRRADGNVALRTWGNEIIGELCTIVDAIPGLQGSRPAVETMRERLKEPESTLSARMLAEMREGSMTFFHYALRESLQRQREALDVGLPKPVKAEYESWAHDSLAAQAELERSDSMSFEAYLEAYFQGQR